MSGEGKALDGSDLKPDDIWEGPHAGIPYVLKADGRDIIGRFRELAPSYPPISVQRWTWRRIGLMVWVVVVALVVLSLGLDYFQRVGMLP